MPCRIPCYSCGQEAFCKCSGREIDRAEKKAVIAHGPGLFSKEHENYLLNRATPTVNPDEVNLCESRSIIYNLTQNISISDPTLKKRVEKQLAQHEQHRLEEKDLMLQFNKKRLEKLQEDINHVSKDINSKVESLNQEKMDITNRISELEKIDTKSPSFWDRMMGKF